MFSAGWGESGGGDPTDCTPPLTTGLGPMGVHLPTLRGATGGLLGAFGGSGRKIGVGYYGYQGLPACPLSFWKPRSSIGGNVRGDHVPAAPNSWAAPLAVPVPPG